MAIGELGAADFLQLKASKALLKSITKNTVRKDDISLTKTCFDLQSGIVSRLEAQIFCFEKIYLKRELCCRALFNPPVHLKTMLGLHAASLLARAGTKK